MPLCWQSEPLRACGWDSGEDTGNSFVRIRESLGVARSEHSPGIREDGLGPRFLGCKILPASAPSRSTNCSLPRGGPVFEDLAVLLPATDSCEN